jgi:hypothetical protein
MTEAVGEVTGRRMSETRSDLQAEDEEEESLLSGLGRT